MSELVLVAETVGIASLVLVVYGVVKFYLYVKRMEKGI